MSLIGKIHADLTIDVSEKMVQKFPNGSTAAGAAVDSGYAERKGDRLVCKILFAKGAAHRQRETSGNSGAWRSAAPREGAEVPPPQE